MAVLNIPQHLNQLGAQARLATRSGLLASTEQKNRALLGIAKALKAKRKQILQANQLDIKRAENKNLAAALIDRLALNSQRIDAMITCLNSVAGLSDPIGEISNLQYQRSGIQVGQMRVPLGVLGIIYEARPNVTIEAAALSIKSANAVILKGGSEAIDSNRILFECIQQGLHQADLNVHLVQWIDSADRAVVDHMLTMSNDLDALIPRGGRQLIETVEKKSKIPVIRHLDGVCHLYIDQYADSVKAVSIAINAKTHRYGTCNTLETLLIHKEQVTKAMPELLAKLTEKKVQVKLCASLQKSYKGFQIATEQDWHTEYLAPILSIREIGALDEAIEHINHYGSHHTDAIVTENYKNVRHFLTLVDSSSVMVNASTRFADGFEYGLGAEIGISTNKLHVRGPVGLLGLTTQKYIVLGAGHIRQ